MEDVLSGNPLLNLFDQLQPLDHFKFKRQWDDAAVFCTGTYQF